MFHRNSTTLWASRSISALALVPMLLWPVVVRSNCCCVERERTSALLSSGNLLSGHLSSVDQVDAEIADVSVSADAREAASATCVLDDVAACPMCCSVRESGVSETDVSVTNDSKTDDALGADVTRPAAVMATCDCQVSSSHATLALRVELPQTSETESISTIRLAAFSGFSPSTPAILHGSHFTPEQSWTSNQRCALLCCWLI